MMQEALFHHLPVDQPHFAQGSVDPAPVQQAAVAWLVHKAGILIKKGAAPRVKCGFRPRVGLLPCGLMRVLMVTGRSDRPEAHCIAGLHRDGVAIRLLGDTTGPYFGILQQAGVAAEHLVIPHRASIPALLAIRRAVRTFRPDVVHVFTNKALACSIPALLGSRAPLVCYRGTTGHLSLPGTPVPGSATAIPGCRP
jgi:hypothetical protein